MITLRKCKSCDTYLIPVSVESGELLLHPHNPQCELNDLNKSFVMNVDVLDPNLWKTYETEHKPTMSDYSVEEAFKAYKSLNKVYDAVPKERSLKGFVRLVRWWLKQKPSE